MLIALPVTLLIAGIILTAVCIADRFNQHHSLSTRLGIAAVISGFTWFLAAGIAAATGILHNNPLEDRALWGPLLLPAVFLIAAAIASIIENRADIRFTRAHGYPIPARWPRWTVLTIWIAATYAIPYAFLYAAGAALDSAQLTAAEVDAAASALAAAAMLLALAIFALGLIDTYLLRERRIRRDLRRVGL